MPLGAIFGPLGAKIGLGLSAVLLVVVGVLWWQNGRLERRLEACRTQHAQFRADVAAKTELARISDAAHKARVEREQERERAENDQEIRRRIADAVASVRRNTQAGNSGSSRAPVSRPADAARNPAGADTAPLISPDDLTICATNTVKLEGWRDWYEAIRQIER